MLSAVARRRPDRYRAMRSDARHARRSTLSRAAASARTCLGGRHRCSRRC